MNQGDGSYLATCTGVSPGTAISFQGWSDGKPFTLAVPTVTVMPAAASVMRVASNNQQTGTVGALLPLPLAALVTDFKGNPVAGEAVSWSAGS